MAAADTWRAPPGVIRSQIVENCSFFSPPGAQLSVILTREPLGTYKAIILRAEPGGQREVLLSSESADTIHRTFELLLVKSADAVQNYITTNGFEFAPCSKKVEDLIAEDDDDGVSSASSSEILDDDPGKDLQDSTLSLSEAESAYESASEDGIDGRYPRARVAHHHAYPMQVRRSRSPMLDDPSFAREGRQQKGPHHLPPHELTGHRRRPTFARVSNPHAAVVAGPMDRHIPHAGVGGGGGAPPAPPPMHAGGAWRPGPMGPIPPAVPDANARNLRPDPSGMPRPHPSQFFSLHPPPPPPGMKGGPPPPPPPPPPHPHPHPHPVAEAVVQQHPHARPPVNNGINRDVNGPLPMAAGMPPMMGMVPMQVPNYYHQQPLGPAAPPTPSTSSSSSPSIASPSSTPTLAPSPNKPQSPTIPAPIDYRLCIRSRGAQADQQKQHKQQQWHEQRIVMRSPPTRGHIRAAALQFVDGHPGLFGHLYNNNDNTRNALNGDNNDNSSSSNNKQHHHHTQVGAWLTRAVLGDGESYDLSTYTGDDLSRLCAGACAPGQGGMPLFEVTVSNLGPVGSFFTLS